jgi:putative hydrolase of the HAD superfamily
VCDVGFTPSPVLRRHLERHGLLACFDHWAFSDEVGVYKPDPRIFAHALAGLGAGDPTRCAHVGDRRRTDIAGAQAMGMRAIRLTTVFDDDDPEAGPPGDIVLSRYENLVPALGLA